MGAAFESKSIRVSMNRWMAVLRSARQYKRHWHARLIAYLCVAILEQRPLPKVGATKKARS